MKKINLIYWTTTILIVLVMGISGIGFLLGVTHFKEVLSQLGYPPYFAYILAFSKLTGIVALLFTQYALLRQWAYAGFAFLLIAATISHAAIGQIDHTILSLFWLLILFISYATSGKVYQSSTRNDRVNAL